MSTLQANHNTGGMDLASLTAIASELGTEHGKGKDTQVKMLMKIVEAAYHNAIDLDKNKHGLGVDDVTKLAEAYVKGQTGATIFDAKAPNQRKLISCFRSCGKLGSWPKGGTGEPLGTMNNLMTHWRNLRKVPGNAKKMKDAANTLLDYARLQVKRDQLVPDGELKALCLKKDSEHPSAEDLVEGFRNGLQKLHSGKAAAGTAQDNSPEVEQAIQLLTSRLKDIASNRQVDAQGNPV